MALPVPNVTLKPGNIFETIVSGLVIVVAVVFVVFVVIRTGTGHLGSYDLQIRLADAGGVQVGSDVRLGGTKMGTVLSLRLDPANYSAVLDVRVRDDLALPADPTAGIAGSVMGQQFVSITPGRADAKLKPGGEFGQASRGSVNHPGAPLASQRAQVSVPIPRRLFVR